MIFADRLTTDAPRRLRDGYLAVRAKAARTGVYAYAGREVDPENQHGLRDTATVNVLRDENTVFDDKAARSFIGKPVTDNHPTQPVTAENWRDHARGTIMGAMRDGEYLAFDLLLTDAAAIRAVENGKRELSNGYAADLEFGDFTAPDGTKCQARQAKVSGNHVAIVDRGRAGPECAIKDAAVCDAITADRLAELATITKGTPMKKIVLDGLQVDLSDADAVAAAFDKLQTKAADAEKALTDAQAEVSKLTGEKAVVDKELADAKAELDPAKLDARVADRSALVAKAKAIKADITTDGKSDADIRKEVVTAKLGDAAASLDDAAILGAFTAIAADAKPAVTNITPASTVTNDNAAVGQQIRASRYSA